VLNVVEIATLEEALATRAVVLGRLDENGKSEYLAGVDAVGQPIWVEVRGRVELARLTGR
jgi:hypothetical protein